MLRVLEAFIFQSVGRTDLFRGMCRVAVDGGRGLVGSLEILSIALACCWTSEDAGVQAVLKRKAVTSPSLQSKSQHYKALGFFPGGAFFQVLQGNPSGRKSVADGVGSGKVFAGAGFSTQFN